jgi:GT2 family glycosyltransferase
MEDKPLISVIVLNYNGKAYLKKCLSTLHNQTYPNVEIILVDNGSSDGSVEFIREHYTHWIRLIVSPENIGFAAGNNLGIRASKGKYIATLNNDTEADPYWLEELIKGMKVDERIGMCASKIYLSKDPYIIDSVGHIIYRDGSNRGRGRLEEDKGQFSKEEEVFFPSACAALYSKKMLDEIGLFDESFFAYYEDADLGLRARLAGWKCIFLPRAIVYHKYSGTAGAYSPLKAYLVERNRIWMVTKNFPLSFFMLGIVYTTIRFIWHSLAALTGKGTSGKFTAQFSAGRLIIILGKAQISAILYLKQALAERKVIQSKRKVSQSEIDSWFRRFRLGVRELTLKE